ncbi:Phosphoribosylformylglycinamidine synthase [Escherichia coli]|uniref:Phosphoribosylformylglycinamidine synthase n=1 Tax=Escherichia coli TaxID=562 RepID=A0A377AXV1_ECOLX|nr:Phosphoribosylformylglycinamidine synthase [Escherichia coli]
MGLYEAVKAVGEELCPALGLTIPVGKDSMSMKTRWQEGNEEREMTSPLSLVISAFARVEDVRHTITPQLSTEDNALLLIDWAKAITRWAQRRWRRFIVSLATNRQMYAMSRN